MDLKEKKCVPCEGGVPKLVPKEAAPLLKELHTDWEIVNNHKLQRTYFFVNYQHTINFVKQVAAVADKENHHPVMHVYYAKVIVDLWTHAIGGLSENDFILAAKLDTL
ncbi:MAG: 4a-hydroxytetrahydrobiopterin dehydratase [Bacteroidota bacterium]